MSKPKLNLFGPRVALVEINDDVEGSIELPQNRAKIHSLGKVTHVGDGRTFKTGLTADTHSLEKEDIFLKINDIVIFQLPPMMVASMTYQIGDKGYLFIHQADCIARLSNTKAAIENLEILGHFVLASRKRTRVTTGGILLPDVVEDFNDDMNHFHAIQVGGLVNKCKVGDKLILDRTRANKISLTGDEYFYVDQNAIHGVIEDEG